MKLRARKNHNRAPVESSPKNNHIRPVDLSSSESSTYEEDENIWSLSKITNICNLNSTLMTPPRRKKESEMLHGSIQQLNETNLSTENNLSNLTESNNNTNKFNSSAETEVLNLSDCSTLTENDFNDDAKNNFRKRFTKNQKNSIKILQWNTKKLMTRTSELINYTKLYNPLCICIQETCLKSTDSTPSLPGYQIVRLDRDISDAEIKKAKGYIGGGICIYVKNDTCLGNL